MHLPPIKPVWVSQISLYLQFLVQLAIIPDTSLSSTLKSEISLKFLKDFLFITFSISVNQCMTSTYW